MKRKSLKVIIAGSRSIMDERIVAKAVKASGFLVGEVVSGGAAGIDYRGDVYANKRGIPLRKFPANWHEFGRTAGYRRNAEMAMYADALIAIWDGQSKGTKHMIGTMTGLQKPVYVYQYDAKKELMAAIFGDVKK